MEASVDALYEKYLNLSQNEKEILNSAAHDSNIINAIKFVRLYLDGEATQPVISAFMKRLQNK